MTLGRHGAVTPETARRRAMALISEAKGGKDPAALRDKGRKAATMKVLGKRFFGRVCPGPLQAEHSLRVPAFGEVLHRPQDRNPQGDGDPAERHRRTAPWHAGDSLSGQPDPRGAFKNVQLGRVVGSASGRLKPLSARQALQGGEARTIPERGGVHPAWPGSRRDFWADGSETRSAVAAIRLPDADRLPTVGDPEAALGPCRSRWRVS